MYFPKDMFTDNPMRFLVSEIIREKTLMYLEDEVPHGIAVEKERYEEIYAYKEGQVNNNPNQQIINAGTMNPAASGYYATSTLNSYFGRVFYSFDNRYMITANIRWDGSSKFADGNRWGYFPSVSAGWYFSDESFL